MQGKIFWFDTETTGLDPRKNDIWQFAGIIEIDGDEMERFELLAKPDMECVEQSALNVSGVARERLDAIETTTADMIAELKQMMSKYVNRYDPNDKFVPAGYNVRFDLDFLREAFKKAGDVKYGIGSWMFTAPIDVMTLVGMAISKMGLRCRNYKLQTVAERVGVKFNAHDALSDIDATMRLGNAIMQAMGNGGLNR